MRRRDQTNGGSSALYFFCDQCGKRLLSRKGLKLHVQTAHEGVPPPKKVDAPSTCAVCGETFKSRGQIQWKYFWLRFGLQSHLT